jgi:UDP-glucose 4-epimerase
MQDTLGLKVKVRYKKRRGFDVPVNVLDCALLRKETGWGPKVPLEAGMKRVCEWLSTTQEKP